MTIIREWLQNGSRPEWQEIAKYGQPIKGYWLQWDSMFIRDDLLTRKWESPDGKTLVYQTLLSGTCIQDVLQELHDSRSGGHYGINRT